MPTLETVTVGPANDEVASAPKAKTTTGPSIEKEAASTKKRKADKGQAKIASFFTPRNVSGSSVSKKPSSSVKGSSPQPAESTTAPTKKKKTPSKSSKLQVKFSAKGSSVQPPTDKKASSKVKDDSSTTPSSNTVTPVHKRTKPRCPDKKQIMEIVLGSAVEATENTDKEEVILDHPEGDLPIPGIRNLGLGKDLQKSRVTPSPPHESPSKTLRSATEQDTVNVKLLEKLEKAEDTDESKDSSGSEGRLQACEGQSTVPAVDEKHAKPVSELENAGKPFRGQKGEETETQNVQRTVDSADNLHLEADPAIHGGTTEFAGNVATASSNSEKEPEVSTQEKSKEQVQVDVDMNKDEHKEPECESVQDTTKDKASDPSAVDVEFEQECAMTSESSISTKVLPVNVVDQESATKKVCVSDKSPGDKENPDEAELPAEIVSTIGTHDNMRSRYCRRVEELVQRAREGLEEEKFSLPKPNELQMEGTENADTLMPTGEQEFPDVAIRSLALVIQGSPVPLATLAERAMEVLQESCGCSKFTIDAVLTKIKLLASRESYITHPVGQSNAGAPKTDVFEDTNSDRMWRWELVSLDLLPDEFVSKVKRARAARRKLRAHHRAVTKLLASLDEADKLLRDLNSQKQKRDSVLARISSEEEKVLKYEREAEKNRLAGEAKKKKEQAKLKKDLEKQKEKAQKQKEKEEAEEERRKEKALRQAEKERKKQEAARAREELKRKKEEEKEAQRKKERLEKEEEAKKKEEKTMKQRAMMKSFFGSPSKSTPSGANGIPKAVPAGTVPNSFNSDLFRSKINSMECHPDTPPFPSLSDSARSSRTRRTRKVPVTVFVTVIPENPFAERPYDEQREIAVPNKFKYLSFHEDYRPPYHGTWSKPRSSNVTGRNPFGKETAYLNYDEDSEAEWEEGDDEPGEDLGDDAADDEEDNLEDEEGDTRVYNYQDGWLTHDDDLGRDGEIDAETMALRRKKLEAAENVAVNGEKTCELSTVCVISPWMGGLPFTTRDTLDEDRAKELIEGVPPSEARKFLASHEGKVCTPELDVCWDAFPPHLVDECVPKTATPTSPKCTTGKVALTKEMSKEDLKKFVQFVHNCTLPSKDKVVEELRTQHKDITSSRAQATRKLDSIAVKKRNPKGGVVWEVKKTILEELGLEALLQVEPPSIEPANQEQVKCCTSNTSVKTPPAISPTDAATDSDGGKQRKRPSPNSSSAMKNLFAAFLKKQKVDDTK